MAARAIWKAELVLDTMKVPVKLYSGVTDRDLHFRLLDRKSSEPIMQKMVDPGSGEAIERAEARKGFEIEPGVFVLLDEEELDALEPEPSREISITRFVEPSLIGTEFYDHPYYLGPDGAADEYWGLVAALEDSGKEGIARWAMRKKDYVGALRVDRGHLALLTLRFADEVVSADGIPVPENDDLEKRELDMARQLVAMLEGPFEPEAYQDEYRDRVEQLIATKARGGKIKRSRPRAVPKTTSLTAALEKSLAAFKKRKTA